MTQPAVSEANWAIEVCRDDGPSEFYSITALAADGKVVALRTIGGTELQFSREKTTKVVLMRTIPQDESE